MKFKFSVHSKGKEQLFLQVYKKQYDTCYTRKVITIRVMLHLSLICIISLIKIGSTQICGFHLYQKDNTNYSTNLWHFCYDNALRSFITPPIKNLIEKTQSKAHTAHTLDKMIISTFNFLLSSQNNKKCELYTGHKIKCKMGLVVCF